MDLSFIFPFFSKKSEHEEAARKLAKENIEVAKRLKEKIAQARATLNGEDNWGVCLTKNNNKCLTSGEGERRE